MLLYPVQYEPEEIDAAQIHLYDAAGNEIPPDSMAPKIIKDSTIGSVPHISRIQIDEDK